VLQMQDLSLLTYGEEAVGLHAVTDQLRTIPTETSTVSRT